MTWTGKAMPLPRAMFSRNLAGKSMVMNLVLWNNSSMAKASSLTSMQGREQYHLSTDSPQSLHPKALMIGSEVVLKVISCLQNFQGISHRVKTPGLPVQHGNQWLNSQVFHTLHNKASLCQCLNGLTSLGLNQFNPRSRWLLPLWHKWPQWLQGLHGNNHCHHGSPKCPRQCTSQCNCLNLDGNHSLLWPPQFQWLECSTA